ncbi:hypothetical protein TH1_101 [Shewanella phage Thanatos-1]|nr:hypothetical protein TH1_101 [Shewanella phage Thanatos-1]
MTIYTMIGSKNTPYEPCEVLRAFAYKMASLNHKGRSGGAIGSDEQLEKGVFDYIADQAKNNINICPSSLMEIYLPRPYFNGKSKAPGYIVPDFDCPLYKKAGEIASTVHPKWSKCNLAARQYHSRNVYQVKGLTLDILSEFVICWAPPVSPGSDMVQGGTATAVKLAIMNKIPVINIWYKDQMQLVKRWLNDSTGLCLLSAWESLWDYY